MKTLIACAIVLAAVTVAPVAAQMQHDKAAMDHRGHQAMGWDQSKATHTFADSAEGGRIDIAAKDPADEATITAIRTHLQVIAKSFKGGDFEKPLFIHGNMPPGVSAMTRLKDEITYTYEERPQGGRVVIASANPDAVKGVHQFLKFQREEHAGR